MSGRPLRLVAAAAGDAAEIEALERRCASHPWTARQFAEAIRGAAGEHVVVLKDQGGAIAGYCVWQEVADEAHVHNLAIEPSRRREGLGRFLLRSCLGCAARRQARRAFLEVRAGNVAARSLYRRLGFREVGTRAAYYMEPVEDAVLLEAEIEGALREGGTLKTGEAAC